VPTITKSFAPDPIDEGGVSTLTFTITNPNAGTGLTSVTFDDTFPTSPGSMVVADTPNTSTSCGGAVTAPAGAGSISFSGGSIAASGTCTVTVNITAPVPGTYTNISSVVSSNETPDSGTATDTLVVTDVLSDIGDEDSHADECGRTGRPGDVRCGGGQHQRGGLGDDHVAER